MVYTRYEMRTSSECQNISRQVNFTIALVSPFRIEIRKFTSLSIYKYNTILHKRLNQIKSDK